MKFHHFPPSLEKSLWLSAEKSANAPPPWKKSFRRPWLLWKSTKTRAVSNLICHRETLPGKQRYHLFFFNGNAVLSNRS